ncbi:MAG: hypothetical protein CHACPFDD_02347 [Phycisphaerae bacterium]|nr:hypothetical protein [Phycisphaerae bacterium]
MMRTWVGGMLSATALAILMGGCPPTGSGAADAGATENTASSDSAATEVVASDTAADHEATDTPTPGAGEALSYAAHIQPIFDANCITCHRNGGLAQRSGISMTLVPAESYASIVNQQSSQHATLVRVAPGKPDESLLYLKVSLDDPPIGQRMPYGCGRLHDDQLEAIRRWIADGALNN